jgi:hypothetical protein
VNWLTDAGDELPSFSVNAVAVMQLANRRGLRRSRAAPTEATRRFNMERFESAKLPDNLPKPVVLRPEDLASVAAAGGVSAVPGMKVIIAGGLPVGPYMS